MSAGDSPDAAAIPARRRRPSWVRRNERVIWGLAGILGFGILWELGSRNGLINPYFFSRPSAIAAAGVRASADPEFWQNARASATEFSVGYLASIVLAVPIGLLAGWYRRLQYLLDPWVNFLNSLPRVALLPIILIWFGISQMSTIVVVFLGAFFSIIIPTIQGVHTVDRRYLDVATSFRASRAKVFLTVVAPATVPFIVTGLRLGIARALIGVMTGELFGGQEGIGVMIKKASEAMLTDATGNQGGRMFFGVLLFTTAGILGVEAIRRIEKYFQRWRPTRQGA